MIYRKRVADELLKIKLQGIGAVLVEGAKWCGKTTDTHPINIMLQAGDNISK